MGLKENFKQAAQELIHGPETTDGFDQGNSLESDVVKQVDRRGFEPVRPTPTAHQQHTVIAKGDTIVGDLKCAGDLEFYGTLTGNVVGKGNLRLCGTMSGDVQGQTAQVCGGYIKGNVIVSGRLEVDSDSIILGDIKAESLLLRGRVRGNLDIKGVLALSEQAAVLGKITTGRFSVAEGAVFQSEVTIHAVDFERMFERTAKAELRSEVLDEFEKPEE